ncbi:MAG: hypothetical protein DHS20C14_00440 [Phycisphaeraceae bacterium]|nr:MAG: hypothetical protein DHS20C14_00440 [Phycisphaeraceae bacterium]
MKTMTAACALTLAAGAASASLTITEIWAGGVSGTEQTADWVEITNFGNSSVSFSGVYYDDDSADATKDDEVFGIGSIAAGESVIVLVSWEDNWGSATDALDAFAAVWGAGNLAGVQIGYVDGGSGLGGGGDAAYFFDGNTSAAATLASQSYAGPALPASFIYNPGTISFGDLAQGGVYGAYTSDQPASDDGTFAIGSPGVVPAPMSAAVLGLGGLAAMRRRR